MKSNTEVEGSQGELEEQRMLEQSSLKEIADLL